MYLQNPVTPDSAQPRKSKAAVEDLSFLIKVEPNKKSYVKMYE